MPRRDVMSRLSALLVGFLVVGTMTMVKVNPVVPASPPKLESRQYSATFLSGDVTGGPFIFWAVDDGWDNPNKKWFRYIDSTEATITILGYEPQSADMSFVTRTSLTGRNLLWTVRIRTVGTEYYLGQTQRDGLVTYYEEAKDRWIINFDHAKCTIYQGNPSTKVGECVLTFNMIIERLPR
jgi:hypothetical protein